MPKPCVTLLRLNIFALTRAYIFTTYFTGLRAVNCLNLHLPVKMFQHLQCKKYQFGDFRAIFQQNLQKLSYVINVNVSVGYVIKSVGVARLNRSLDFLKRKQSGAEAIHNNKIFKNV